MPLELHEQKAADLGLLAFEPQAFSRRADAGAFFEIDLKIVGGVAVVGPGFLGGGAGLWSPAVAKRGSRERKPWSAM